MVLKRRLLFLFALTLALAWPAPARASGDAAEFTDYVRLHVVAADDTETAQALKLRVRDAVLAQARALLADCADADAAWARVNAGIDALARAATSAARAGGYTGEVRCETGVYAFPNRQYGGVTVPAGDYRALRVVIGAGRGRNWWCVLYPSLCYPEGVEPDAPGRFHSTLLNWIRRLLGGASK